LVNFHKNAPLFVLILYVNEMQKLNQVF